MVNNLYEIKTLISLLGLDRFDKKIKRFISQFDLGPFFTVDKEDDADDEYIEFKEQGFCLYFEENILLSIFIHSGEKGSDYDMYDNPLPMGISFKQSKTELIDLLGSPDVYGGGHDDFFGDIPDWVKYKVDDYTVHIEFTKDLKRIQLITIGMK